MIKKLDIFIVGYLFATSVLAAGMEDDPLLMMVKLDQLEITDGDDSVWKAQGWLGKDLNKLWLKTEGEVADGDLEEAEYQFLYSRAIAPFWDVQVGWRHDSKPTPVRDWLAVGVKGLAPYFFETDVALFIGEKGNVSLRTEFEYEILLSQKWILSPEVEANFFSKNDAEVGVGSGLSDINVGIRLRYEVRREFAPYFGIEWKKSFGETADHIKDEGGDSHDLLWVLGLRAWF